MLSLFDRYDYSANDDMISCCSSPTFDAEADAGPGSGLSLAANRVTRLRKQEVGSVLHMRSVVASSQDTELRLMLSRSAAFLDVTCFAPSSLRLEESVSLTDTTRQHSYRREDRAMRPIYGCPEKFSESSLRTRLLFQKFVMDFCSDRY